MHSTSFPLVTDRPLCSQKCLVGFWVFHAHICSNICELVWLLSDCCAAGDIWWVSGFYLHAASSENFLGLLLSKRNVESTQGLKFSLAFCCQWLLEHAVPW